MAQKRLEHLLDLTWKVVKPLGQVWRASGWQAGALDAYVARVRTGALFNKAGGFYSQGFGRADLLRRFAVELGGQPSSHSLTSGDLQFTGLVQKHIPKIDARPRKVEPLKLTAPPEAWIGEGLFPTVSDTSLLPPESWTAYFQLVVPTLWDAPPEAVPQHCADIVRARPVVVLLPGTGEHGFGRRRQCVALGLARAGVATIILEGPLYGERKPPSQSASKLHTLMDLCILGRATIEEARALLRWAKDLSREELDAFRPGVAGSGAAPRAPAASAPSGGLAFGPLVVAGTSMGGLHAAMTAAMTPHKEDSNGNGNSSSGGAPLAQRLGVVSWLGPPSAAPVFTLGELARAVDWEALAATEAATAPHVDAMEAILKTLRADADAAGYAGDGLGAADDTAPPDFSPYPPFQHSHEQDVVTAHEHLLAAAPGQVVTGQTAEQAAAEDFAENAKVLQLWGGAAIKLGRRRHGARQSTQHPPLGTENPDGAWEAPSLRFPHTPLPPAVYSPKAAPAPGDKGSRGFPLPLEVTVPLPRLPLPLPWQLPASLTFSTASVAAKRAGTEAAVAAATTTVTTVAAATASATSTTATAASQSGSTKAARSSLWAEARTWSAGTLASRKLMARFLRITDLTNMPVPARPDAAVFVVADDDRYVPWTRSVVSQWITVREKLWRGASLRVIRGGHVSGSLFEGDAYSKTVVEVIRRLLAPPPSK